MLKQLISRYIPRLLGWLNWSGVYIDPFVRILRDGAAPLVLAQEDILEVSGEYKLHQVYAQMLKQFPGAPKDDVAFAIQLAIRKMKGKLYGPRRRGILE